MTPKIWIPLLTLALSALLYSHADTSRSVKRILANPGSVNGRASTDGSESATLREDPEDRGS